MSRRILPVGKRSHYRQMKEHGMKRLMTHGLGWGAMAASVALVTWSNVAHVNAAGHGGDNDRGHHACSVATLRGDYGIQIQGTRPSAPVPGSAIETVIGVVLRRYDGRGEFTQIDNVKGSISGITPNRFGSGTYVVNADCTGVVTAVPGQGIKLEEQIVIVDDAREIRSIVVDPPFVMVSGCTKKDGRPIGA